MPKRLVIVESPAKARTIAGYLGPEFVVESSVGHIRDLPDSAAEVPEKYKGEPWARLGVDVEHGFEPLYVVDPDKKKTVAQLRKELADADELLLATDEDREGEAIAWHLLEVLKPKVPVRRMVFHEITRDAIERALGETRDVDERLVDAQESRRILDRLYGYEVSPVLWKKIMRGLSAGRVQSVATRLVVERERERMAFRAAAWWDLLATFDPESFEARLVSLDGQRVATGRDFGPDGKLRGEASQLDEAAARGLAERLEGASFHVARLERKPYVRRPSPPFMTSTLQQEASRKLRYSAQTTMRLAQRLYENGYITYMRTDSTTLSESALTAAREQASSLFGADFVPPQPRRYERKVKNAQEAHEAIRPSGDRFRTPQDVRSELSPDEHALYELIWMRTIASQMKDAQGQTVSLRIAGDSTAAESVEFGASGTVITFRGFLAAYEEGRDIDRPAQEDDEERRLPNLAEGDPVELRALEPQGHETSPPARYTEATLVRTLEELGIGRPSTYASILGTILDRGYVFKRGTALVPAFLAFSVVNLLEQHFGRLVDYDFTARMEDDLDRIAAGDEHRVEWLGRFYFGDGPGAAEGGAVFQPGAGGSADGASSSPGLQELVSDLGAIDAREINSLEIGEGIVLRVGRYGPYLERDGQRASVPEELAPDELTLERAEELLAQPTGDRELGTDPETGLPISARTGRYGPYVTDVLHDGSKEKPRTASLFKTMSLETVSLDDALRLLQLPRVVGVGEDGEEVVARNGRYGPFVQKGKESRSLESEEQLFTIELPGALALLAQPRQRRGQRASAKPLREIGTDPAGGREIVLKEGRFGPYVTDGETNASLRKGDDPETIALDRAVELLAERRAKGPAKRSTRRRRGS
ncbi:MAG TPA: type I DNA topoisomerase [Gaiellaceae bacterium]|jgi:DNA topoisomerase-1|nr:type I DNA topoisomerase [Gaiellaceae bacterium]